jgi:hypothetical protein
MNKSTSNTNHQRLGRLSLAAFGLLSRSLSSLRCLIALVIAHAPLVEVHPDVVRVNDYRRSDGRHKFPVLRNGSVSFQNTGGAQSILTRRPALRYASSSWEL